MSKITERTSFTKDIQGRYLCNDIAEVNTWKRGGGRPFDVLVIGGGTFGAALAEHVWFRQKHTGGGLRTLVIEAGLFTVPEHVQNTGIQGFTDPGTPLSLDENAPQPEPPRNEVWGIPWRSSIPFKGLAYTIGGRSVYWGGWSPRLLPQEVTTWPRATIADLNAVYFDESARQIGVDETNDFMFGELHHALRKQLFDNLDTVDSAIPLDELPPSPLLKPAADLAQLLGLDSTVGLSPDDLKNLLKLEAPLAVQARAPRAGFFPLNKFSTVPLLMKAARTAYADANGDDAKKEFMVLPDTHAVALRTMRTGSGTWRVIGVDTSVGFIELAPGGVAVIALGTIENTRLALSVIRRHGHSHVPADGEEPDRARAVESRHSCAARGHRRTRGDHDRAAGIGAVRQMPRETGTWRSARTLSSPDHCDGRRQQGRLRGRAVQEDSRRRPLRSLAHLDRHACSDRDSGNRRNGRGG